MLPYMRELVPAATPPREIGVDYGLAWMAAGAGVSILSFFTALSFVAVSLGPLLASNSPSISFLSTRQGNWDVYVMDTRLSLIYNLTHHPADDWFPAWSPDGRRLAFRSTRDGNDEIYVMDSNGRNLRRLTNHRTRDIDPAWSPDGRRLAFVSYRSDPGGDIYVMDADCIACEPQRLTFNSVEDLGPDWSPDGQHIVFYSLRRGNTDIFVIDTECGDLPEECSRNARQLTHEVSNDRFPAWSPDGERIAFVSNRAASDEIFVMDTDGGSVRQLTDRAGADWYPAWSPDGRSILFQSYRDGNADLYVMDAECGSPPEGCGSDVRRLTFTRFQEWFPIWWP